MLAFIHCVQACKVYLFHRIALHTTCMAVRLYSAVIGQVVLFLATARLVVIPILYLPRVVKEHMYIRRMNIHIHTGTYIHSLLDHPVLCNHEQRNSLVTSYVGSCHKVGQDCDQPLHLSGG